MRWQLQVLQGTVKTTIPFSTALRQLKRTVSGYPYDVSNLNITLEDAFKMAHLLRTTECEVKGSTVLEIGSGWFPVIPILYIILGARRVVLSDLYRYMDDNTFHAACNYVRQNTDRVAEGLRVRPSHVLDVLNRANTPAELVIAQEPAVRARLQP
jgi:hypothetical protein